MTAVSCSRCARSRSGYRHGPRHGSSGLRRKETTGDRNAESDVPRCIADLIAPCTCKVAPDGCGPTTCFVAGVTTTVTNLDGGTCGGPGDYEEKHFLKPDGSVCYSTQTYWVPYSGGCEMVRLLWLDPAGNTVASAYGAPSFQPCADQTPQVTCTATGEVGTIPHSFSFPWPRTDCPTSGCR